jgi:hypothetical protein
MITASADQYIYPPRSQDAIPREDTQIFSMLGWIAQYKYNDSHALIKYCPDGQIEIWNRHGERFRTYNLPDYLIEQLRNIGTTLGHVAGRLTILDGGLLDQKHRAIKDTLVVWDILVLNDEYLVGTTYLDRYGKLYSISSQETWNYSNASHDSVSFGRKLSDDVFIPENIAADAWGHAWDTIAKVNAPYTTGDPGQACYECKPVLEGLVFKDPNGTLEMGFKEKNNSSWMIRSRVHTGRHRF